MAVQCGRHEAGRQWAARAFTVRIGNGRYDSPDSKHSLAVSAPRFHLGSALAVRSLAGNRDEGRFVPPDSLPKKSRQGFFAGGYGRGDFRVRTSLVSDPHPLLIGDGEDRELSAGSAPRHLAVDNDVVMAGVGRLGHVGAELRSSGLAQPAKARDDQCLRLFPEDYGA